MAYAVYEDYPEIIDAQQAERIDKLYWPTVRLGTFGALPEKPPCRKCASRKFQVGLDRPRYRIGQPGPFGADPGTTPQQSYNRVGTIIAVASAITVIGLFAATISLGKSKLRQGKGG